MEEQTGVTEKIMSTDTLLDVHMSTIESGLAKTPLRHKEGEDVTVTVKGRKISKKKREEIRQIKRDRYARMSGVCFIILIIALSCFGVYLPDKSFSETENRMLQEMPHFSAMEYLEGRFEKHLENYLNDQFPMRSEFVRVKASMDVTSGNLAANGVYRGRDGYLFEEIKIPDDQDMERTVAALQNFKERHANVKAYFMLAPNSANILQSKLPLTVRMGDQNKYMNDFYDEIQKTGYTPIDVRQPFKKHMGDKQLYYRTDHHWTASGAYVAYGEAAKIMGLDSKVEYEPYIVKNDFCGTLYSRSGYRNGQSDAILVYLPKDTNACKESVIYYPDSKEKTTQYYQLDKLDQKDSYSVFGGSNHPMYTIKTPVKSNRKLLLVKDSYANSMIPFLMQDFREIVVVDPRYFYDSIDDLMESEGVTDVLFLYNANTFFTDDSLELALNAE